MNNLLLFGVFHFFDCNISYFNCFRSRSS